jgi:hypothetical protein
VLRPVPPQTDALVAELRAQLAEMRTERDAWREQAQRLALPKPEPVRTRWWRRGSAG